MTSRDNLFRGILVFPFLFSILPFYLFSMFVCAGLQSQTFIMYQRQHSLVWRASNWVHQKEKPHNSQMLHCRIFTVLCIVKRWFYWRTHRPAERSSAGQTVWYKQFSGTTIHQPAAIGFTVSLCTGNTGLVKTCWRSRPNITEDRSRFIYSIGELLSKARSQLLVCTCLITGKCSVIFKYGGSAGNYECSQYWYDNTFKVTLIIIII